MIQTFPDFCKHQHDVVCNQKYNKTLPYSAHLEFVVAQVKMFHNNFHSFSQQTAVFVAYGHDLIEDARLTYNDIVRKLKDFAGDGEFAYTVADGIYNCTESTGRNRSERHDEAYYNRVLSTELSTFVKLCDIAANIKFGLLTGSDMVAKYRIEFPYFVEKFEQHFEVVTPFGELISHINKLLNL